MILVETFRWNVSVFMRQDSAETLHRNASTFLTVKHSSA
jgi:hypothetical protein